jgi:aspartate aminotransferase
VATHRLSRRFEQLVDLGAPLFAWFQESDARVRAAGSEACDFLVGNPQEMAPKEYVDALRRWAEPKSPAWFAYKNSEPEAREAAAASLRERLGIPFEPEDIAMTNAGIAAIAVATRVVVDEGDEVVIITPPHFLYEPLIRSAGGRTVRVPVDPATFDLDVHAIAGALTPRTKAVLVNTPHNPTGKIYPPKTLRLLADVLADASSRFGTIYLLSDEPYNRILFDGRKFQSPAAFYPNTMLLYSYGKQLLAPGMRIGYIALPPAMADRQRVMLHLVVGQLATGFAFPNAELQYATGELEGILVDMERMQARRDRLVDALRDMGYELHVPEATFYLLVRSPVPNDREFCDVLADERIFAMPGAMLECPGFFRLSLTATDDMIDRSLPGFARAKKRVSGN